MTVGGRPFVAATDRRQVLEWSFAHGKPWRQNIARGWFVPHVAVGFLIRTDAGFHMLEDLVTNPKAPGALRNQAIDEIEKWAEETAAAEGSRLLVAWMEHKGLYDRALRYGYKPGPTIITLVKEL